jgi:prophage maintenance system killer protein
MIIKSQDIISLLSSPFSKKEMGEIQLKLNNLEEAKANLKVISPEGYIKLNRNRLLASNTLLKNDTREQQLWDRANLFIATQISSDKKVSFKLLLELNHIFTSNSNFRHHEIYSGSEQYIELRYLKKAIQKFEDEVISKQMTIHPVLFAFECYKWIVSLHPFTNGNGRTARLAADWILLSNGYLPISFSSSYSSHVAYTIGGKLPHSLQGFTRFCEALSSSYSIVAEEPE